MGLIAKLGNPFFWNGSNFIEQFKPIFRLVGLLFHNRHLG